jgi:hypothetical protein
MAVCVGDRIGDLSIRVRDRQRPHRLQRRNPCLMRGETIGAGLAAVGYAGCTPSFIAMGRWNWCGIGHLDSTFLRGRPASIHHDQQDG